MSSEWDGKSIDMSYDPMDIALDIPQGSFSSEMNISPVSTTTDMSLYEAQPAINEQVLNVIFALIQEHGIHDVISAMWPITTLVDTNTLYMPKKEKIERYIKSFSILFKYHLSVINDIFKFRYIIRNNSVNGQAMVFEVNPSNWLYPKLLIKVPQRAFPYADSLSYEYYVGKTLNRLRYEGIDHFALVYGRFKCGIDSSSTTLKLCDVSQEEKTHVVFEFIQNTDNIENENVKSFRTFIDSHNSQNDSLKVLLLIMISLHKAQKWVRFTHYDLHLENILIVKLAQQKVYTFEVNEKIYSIETMYIPHIIDYGRSHVNPVLVEPDEDNTFKDLDTLDTYVTFQEFQNRFKPIKFVLSPNDNQNVQEYLDVLLQTSAYMEYLANQGVDVTTMYSKYFLDSLHNVVTHGIRTYEFHEHFDHYKLTRLLCNYMMYTKKTTGMAIWKLLDDNLFQSFPFYIPISFNLPTNYSSINGRFNSPIDVADYIYSYIE